MQGKLFLISAPSGAGKTTLANLLVERFGTVYNIERVITYTSKQARSTEKSGIDYHFISEQDFKTKAEGGFFLEWSTAYEAYYGSPRSVLEWLEQGRSFLLIVDRVGAQQIIHSFPEAIAIWIYADSINELQSRLTGRNTDAPKHINYRLSLAHQELTSESRAPLFHYHILNRELERTMRRLHKIIKRELYLW